MKYNIQHRNNKAYNNPMNSNNRMKYRDPLYILMKLCLIDVSDNFL